MSELKATVSGFGRLAGKLGGSGGGPSYQIGDGLKVVEGVLMVDTAEAVERDNTKPVTSGAVYMQLGNVEALLKTI